MAVSPHLKVTSDDINVLIYSYLEDAGFTHTSYALRHEARLDASPNLNVRMPRGELIKLLNKALLYSEAEAHFRRRQDANHPSTECTAPFSILKTHVCSGGSQSLPSPPEIVRRRQELFPPPRPGSPSFNNTEKRKASPKADSRAEKRARTEEEVQDTVSSTGVRIRKGYGDGVILMNGHESEVFICQWHPLKPNVLATGSKDATVRLWNVPVPPAPLFTPVALRHIPDPTDARDITAIDWDRTGARIATGCYDGIVRVWTAEGAHQFNLKFHQGPIFANRWSPCASYLLSASLDGTLVVWDMMTLKPDKIQQLFRVHTGEAFPLVGGLTTVLEFQPLGSVLDAVWLDSKTFISCSIDRHISICRLGEQNPIKTFVGHEDEVNLLRLSKDHTTLASSSDDRTVRVWDLAAWQAAGADAQVRPPAGQADPYQKTSFDNTSRIWDTRDGSCIRELLNHRDRVYTHSFSPRGRYLATGSADGRVLIYDLASGQILFEWDCQSGGVFEIEWQNTGDQLGVCLENRGVAILDMRRFGLSDHVETPLPPPNP
ncbi:hypothetical protein FRB99_005947 [Tulasnella sp. 403]|nr:hypothetical protein FRB99_005947 [Tulasnella sp. 403]